MSIQRSEKVQMLCFLLCTAEKEEKNWFKLMSILKAVYL